MSKKDTKLDLLQGTVDMMVLRTSHRQIAA